MAWIRLRANVVTDVTDVTNQRSTNVTAVPLCNNRSATVPNGLRRNGVLERSERLPTVGTESLGLDQLRLH